MKNIVIIPTYNEKDNIAVLAERVLANAECDLLFVDDNSPDGTGELIKELIARDGRVKLIERGGKLGLGSAYLEGFKFAFGKSYERIIMMDADLSHPPEKIGEMLGLNTDYVVGSRYVRGGRVTGWPLRRHFLSRGANLYASFVLGIGVNDVTSGFNCVKMEVLKSIDLGRIRGEGYAFLVELKHNAFKKGYKPKEIPITFKEREKGVSKISKNIIWEAFWLVLKLKFFQ
jgi:dolichol-phosphate mannosyltransferase